jgi:hypothetical protein
VTPDETLRICRMTKALCPAQAMDEFTPDAWHMVLEPYPLADAETALRELARELDFIGVKAIDARITRIRTNRIKAAGDVTPPPGLTDAEEREWLRDFRRRVADGERVDIDYGELVTGPSINFRELLPSTDTTTQGDES